MNLSHSTIAGLLDDCAYRVGLQKIVKLPSPPNGRLAAGIAYHAAIEAHEQARMWEFRVRRQPTGLPLDVLLELADQALMSVDVNWQNDDLGFDDARSMMEVALRHWYETPIPEGQPGAGGSLRDRVMAWRPVATERWWKLWLPPYTSLPVVGALDNAYLDEDGELVIVDHKSANRFGKYRLDGVGLKDQSSMYVMAAMKSPALPGRRNVIPRFEYHIARTTEGSNKRFEGARVVEISVDKVDLEYIEDRVARAHQQQLSGEWPKNPDSFFCSEQWCPFWGTECDPHGPNERDIEAYR